MLPLWFRANSGLSWPLQASSGGGPVRLRAATAHAVGRGLRFHAPAVVSCDFRCVSTLPLWINFARLPLRFDSPAVVSRDFRPLLASSREFRCVSTVSCEFRCVSTLAAVVSREFRRVSIARIPASSGIFWGWPLRLRAAFFETSSGLLWPLLALLTVWGLRRHNLKAYGAGGHVSDQPFSEKTNPV